MMVWLILFLSLLFTMYIFVPVSKLKYLWRAGAVSMLTLYITDSNLIWMHAFSYTYPAISGLPVFYLLSAFPVGVLLCNYCPKRNFLRLIYAIVVSALLLIPEFIIHSIGAMLYIHWNLFRSFLINIPVFSTVLWFSQCLGVFDDKIEKQ